MKKLFLFLVVLAGMVSCQVIKPEDRYIKLEEEVEGERNVLLMDFTGWRCPNCPEAAKVANALTSNYGSHVIVVSMHPEGISFTDPGTSGPKFASAEAMEYLKAFGGSAQSALPTGVIDGQQYNGSYFLKYQDWAAVVTDRLKVDVEYSMEMSASTTTCMVDLHKKGEDDRKVNVVVWLLEDSIIAPQSTTGEEIHEYAHRHVFRKCLNGTDIWGEEAEFDEGDAYVEAVYQMPTLEGRNFVIVAVAIDAETHEVLQAEEVELKQKGEGSFEIVYDGKTLQDGDSLDINDVHEEGGIVQFTFEGYFNSTYAEENEFTIVEKRDFDYTLYTVSMCVDTCMPDNPDHPGYWSYTFDGFSENKFQSHIDIPEELIDVPVDLTTDYTFGDGVKTKTIRVKFHYNPEPK